jgi:hypothetical protein
MHSEQIVLGRGLWLKQPDLRVGQQFLLLKVFHCVRKTVASERMAFPKIIAFEFFVEAYACCVDQSAVRQNSRGVGGFKIVSRNEV